ncbi:Protein CBG03872 [Caenorhabditis briggsae]|uniref:Protein CBG03872 n=1 Tax=Caenorhabditis briggsae TaxID=6238 RepID=A8WWY9_CAEBR|nr:Protein CBG03872 [Caenorhabditis briggsae]CAP24688.2 Protein CBG03872 [Caenorhabditis briggsae]
MCFSSPKCCTFFPFFFLLVSVITQPIVSRFPSSSSTSSIYSRSFFMPAFIFFLFLHIFFTSAHLFFLIITLILYFCVFMCACVCFVFLPSVSSSISLSLIFLHSVCLFKCSSSGSSITFASSSSFLSDLTPLLC